MSVKSCNKDDKDSSNKDNTSNKSHTHSIEAVAKKDATFLETGYNGYYKCATCEKYLVM